jgi:protein-disulfide isomerase
VTTDPSKSSRLADAAILVLTVCMLTLTGLLLRRELFPAKPDTSIVKGQDRDWRELAATGRTSGPVNARVTIVEFSDFQCGYCRLFDSTLAVVTAERPTEIRRVYRHLPLTAIHAAARKAALLAECSGEEGQFWEVHDALYRMQDSIGHIPWDRFLTTLPKPARARVMECHRAPPQAVLARLSEDEKVAEEKQFNGTPTVFVNDRQLRGAATYAQLDSLIRAIANEQ